MYAVLEQQEFRHQCVPVIIFFSTSHSLVKSATFHFFELRQCFTRFIEFYVTIFDEIQ